MPDSRSRAASDATGGDSRVRAPSRPLLRRAAVALAAVVLLAAAAAGCGGDPAPPGPSSTASVAEEPPVRPVRIAVRRRVVSWVDTSRQVTNNDGTVTDRRLTTVIRFPHVSGGTEADRRQRFPLVVFLHGYDLVPGSYRTLLRAWARAGFVVAAPVLPGESALAPGGPNRGDLLNQPADARFVIDRLLDGSSVASVIDGQKIAVAGHSDGGSTALAVAYDARYRDTRIGAAIVLAGADLPGIAPFAFPPEGPPLLAVQGTADTVNPVAATAAYYDRATVPRFLLTLLGGGHFDPYMQQRPQVDIVARVATAFLARSLRSAPISSRELIRRGTRAGVAALTAAGG